MNFSKSIFTLAIASLFFVGCKDKTTVALNNEETKTSKKEIAAAVKPQTASFKIEGMSCAIGCAKTIEEKLTNTNGVQNAKVDFETKQATVNFDADKLSSNDLIKTVEDAADGKTYKVSDIKTGNKV